ncbi:hypothetical protein F4827_004267 [Paraburkholderia bannensis]|uniref:DUF4123 domain-containing protein n=1 Tax=Paraburkholderia bannensis TaxID=765414 RepID=A0A7W9TZU0_9BURK|nr:MULTISPECIES: DUF4123 domain-containing protein [Paraburkholderia]MBB3259392.1 hypothetical protein [Paraburkholderia sp. WP4_3_2]MBB6104408.1 hypothetical protein [Paraburkholderia bannensis]
MYRYILLDSSQHMRFSSRLDRLGAQYISLFDGHPEEPFRDIAPLLIDVTVDGDVTRSVIDETTRIGLLKPCVSTLDSTKSLHELGEHLRKFHLFEMPGGKLIVMRWYDTRILPAVMSVLNPQQAATFSDGITAWKIYNRFGLVEEQQLPNCSDLRSREPIPLTLDFAQEQTLFDAAEPDKLIHELRRNIRAEIDRVPRDILHPFISSQWQRARECGITDRDDQLQLMILALSTSGNYVEYSGIADRLKAGFANSQEPFQQWIETLPAEAWTAGQPLWAIDAKAQENSNGRSASEASHRL